MKKILDPTHVEFDAGYNVFIDPIEIWAYELRGRQTLGITPNAEVVYTPEKATIWIRALVNTPPGEIISVAPPMKLRFGMSPTALFGILLFLASVKRVIFRIIGSILLWNVSQLLLISLLNLSSVCR